MPYIKQTQRDILIPQIANLVDTLRDNFEEDEIEGALNYTVSRVVAGTLQQSEGQWRYYLINRALGVLEAVKLEFYRRVAGPYENKAVYKNGDINEYHYF